MIYSDIPKKKIQYDNLELLYLLEDAKQVKVKY